MVGGCTTCDAGHYCPVGSIFPLPCPPGTVKPSTGGSSVYDCALPAAGTQATTWGNSNAAGDACKAGHYCPVGSFGQPFPCPAGTYTDATNAADITGCLSCPQSFACEEGTGGAVKAKLK